MDEPSLIKAGKLNKTFGLKGHIRFFMEPEIAARIKKLDTIFVMLLKKPLPFFVDEFDLTETGHGMIHFEDVKDKSAADGLVGREIFVDEKKLKKKKPFTSFADFIGFELIDENRGLIGVLDDVLQLPQHELGRYFFNGKEVLFPWNEDVVRKIDKRKKEITLRLPEGLLDVYL
jgi:16S rRNA processing protein RimM